MIYNKETDVVSVSNNMYIDIKLNLFPGNKKGIDSIYAANLKEEVYVTTGVTLIPRHFATIMRLFFLDVGRDACCLPSKLL